MNKLKYKIIPEGMLKGKYMPISAIFIDYADVKACNLTMLEAFKKIAAEIPGPAGLNMFDMTATTTNSNGIMLDGGMVSIAASDYGKINKEFGYMEMPEIKYSEELIKEEPHLKQWKKSFPERKLHMGPNPNTKVIPIHNAVLTGRAGNNNSGTEMMHYINMEEILLPITGQLEIMKNGKVEVGGTGEVISVGIGMVVGEEFGRIVPHRQWKCGKTAHNSKEYAKTLKSHIPIIAADKSALARSIIGALETGVIPGRDIGASPAVLSIARHMGIKPDMENIEERLTPEQIIEKAHEIIPGVEKPKTFNVSDIVQVRLLGV